MNDEKIHEISKTKEAIENILYYIDNHKLLAHDNLPSERDLSLELGLSRSTIRKALEHLIDVGILYKKASSGTFISEQKRMRNLRGVNQLMTDLRGQGGNIKTEILYKKTITGDKNLSSKLGINLDSEVHQIARIRYLDYEEAFLEIISINGEICENLNEFYNEKSSLSSIYKNIYGTYPISGEEVIQIILPTKEQAETLKTSINDPLIYVSGITNNKDGDHLEYYRIYLKPDKFKLVVS